MKFINEGEAVQVRESDGLGKYKWTLLKKGETIELPESVGIAYRFKKIKVTEGKIGKKKVETKQFEKDKKTDFYNELIKIKGIAWRTAEDIIEVFTKQGLIKAILNKEKLPFRNDIEKKLRRKYGK